MPPQTFPNIFDLDAKPLDPTSKHLNPNVAPFEPHTTNKTNPDLFSWQVVAAEYSGKAVAVLITSDSTMQVCTSPSFNSKCSHQGLSCMDWGSVNLGQGRGVSPEHTFESLHDSGVENSPDNLSEEIEKIERVAKWSAETSRHYEEWTEDVTEQAVELFEDVTSLPQELSEDSSGQVWSAKNHHYYHITVEYHAEDGGHHADDPGYHPAGGGHHQDGEDFLQQEEGDNNRPCYGNYPLVVYQGSSF